MALLENIPTKSLPRHGGTATTVMVILDYDTLLADLTATGIAETSTGEPITAGQARRLACQADILPVVLDGNSEILDVGHLKRLVTDVIRKALNLRDRGCTEVGCTMPAETKWALCGHHHIVPWPRRGVGNGDLAQEFKDCRAALWQGRVHDLAEFNLAPTSIANWVRPDHARAPGRPEGGVRQDAGSSPGAGAGARAGAEILGKALAFFARRADR